MEHKRKIWHWAVVAVLSIIWGTSYIFMKKGLESFSSFQIGSLRIFITFLCLLPVAVKNMKKLRRTNIRSIFIIGLLGSGIPAFLFPLAQTNISSSLAGMLNALSPVFTLVFGIYFYQRKAIKSQVIGVILGLVGAVGLLYSGSFSFNYYGLYIVLATIMYGISANEVSIVEGMNGLQITSLAFLVMSPVAVVFLLLSDFSHVGSLPGWKMNLGCIVLLSVLGSALALSLFYLLIRETSPVFASMITYFVPLVSTLWGLADNEKVDTPMLLSVAVIFAGVYIINRAPVAKTGKIPMN